MARLSLERAIRIMSSAGFDYEENRGCSRHHFLDNKTGIQKGFATGRELVKFVSDKGATVQSIIDWMDDLSQDNKRTDDYLESQSYEDPFEWLKKYENMQASKRDEKQEYINVLTGKSYGYMTEAEAECFFEMGEF